MKVKKSPWTALFPSPVVLVTCGDLKGKYNIITLAWVGIVCSDPPTLSLGIRPQRYSYTLIEETGEFVVNIPNVDLLKEVDFCGVVSGIEVNKFSETNLTPLPAGKVKPPLIKECPVNIECFVKEKMPLGVHHLFLGEVVLVHVDQEILNKERRIDFKKVAPIVYNQGEYWSLQNKIGKHGFSES